MKIRHRLVWLLWIIIPSAVVGQPTLLGQSGLIIVPSARMYGDGVLRVSAGFIPHPYYPVDKDWKDNYANFVSFNYLPFLEISLGVITPKAEQYGIGDRTVGIRLCVKRESRYWPQILLGAQDPFGFIAMDWAQRYSTLFAVASKSFDLPVIDRIELHLGHGVDWIRSGQYYLIGTFGGLEIKPVKPVSLLFEYDTRQVNFGARLSLWKFDLMGAWLEGRSFTGNIGFHFSLFGQTSSPAP